MSMFDRIGDYITGSQIWGSMFRHGAPRDRRTRAMVVLSNVFLHLHPVAIRKSGIRLSFTWCMGGLTFFLFLVETITGVLLMFYYRPTVEYAYADIQGLRAGAASGGRAVLDRAVAAFEAVFSQAIPADLTARVLLARLLLDRSERLAER